MRAFTHESNLEFPVVVNYLYYKAYRGRREEFGVQLEPDEPERIEIEDVTFRGVSIMDVLTNTEIAQLEEEIMDSGKDDYYEHHRTIGY